jgi:hypothetical protein
MRFRRPAQLALNPEHVDRVVLKRAAELPPEGGHGRVISECHASEGELKKIEPTDYRY